MHAKVSARGVRYFAHDPGRPVDCVWLNESLEHHLLKLELATAIRAAGFHAELEVRAPDGSWRADVLASSHDGTHRIAWEAQLSPIAVDDIVERTTRYRDADIGVCWVGIAPRAPWIGTVPSIRVREPIADEPWHIADGVAGFSYQQGEWSTVEDLPLATFVRWSMKQKMLSHPVLPRYRWIRLTGLRSSAARRMVWTTARSVAEEARHEVLRRNQDERKRRAQQRLQEQNDAREREQAIGEAAAVARREKEDAIARAQQQERDAAHRARLEELREQRAIHDERQRQQREAAERERLRREQQEQQAAERWWAELSAHQLEQLRAAVADPVWRKQGRRVELAPSGPDARHGYGIPMLIGHQTHAILRPSPDSTHRLAWMAYSDIHIVLRNAREAALIAEAGTVPLRCITHFDLPDEDQLALL